MPNPLGGRKSGFGGVPGGSKPGKSRSGSTGRSLFDLGNSKPMTAESMTFTGDNLKSLVSKSKKTEGGGDPRAIDKQLQNQNLINSKPLTDVEKAVIEATRQREELALGVQLGAAAAPSLIGPGLTLGNWMGKQTEKDALANPDKYTTNPKDPGSLFSKSGPLSTNRAVELPSQKRTEASENLKKKKQQLPTLLGASANPLGTFSNPVMIT